MIIYNTNNLYEESVNVDDCSSRKSSDYLAYWKKTAGALKKNCKKSAKKSANKVQKKVVGGQEI